MAPGGNRSAQETIAGRAFDRHAVSLRRRLDDELRRGRGSCSDLARRSWDMFGRGAQGGPCRAPLGHTGRQRPPRTDRPAPTDVVLPPGSVVRGGIVFGFAAAVKPNSSQGFVRRYGSAVALISHSASLPRRDSAFRSSREAAAEKGRGGAAEGKRVEAANLSKSPDFRLQFDLFADRERSDARRPCCPKATRVANSPQARTVRANHRVRMGRFFFMQRTAARPRPETLLSCTTDDRKEAILLCSSIGAFPVAPAPLATSVRC